MSSEHEVDDSVPMAWRSVSADPNAADVLAWRSGQLDEAFAPSVASRLDVILPIVAGREVLDLGCVDHLGEALRPDSLHGRIVAAAASVTAADIDAEGIEALRRRGERAIVADLDTEEGRQIIRASGPFDVIVAGELIEHLVRPISLFEVAADVLRPGGRLVLTTPNPFALHRVRSGWNQTSWENVDHLAWSFPSGVAELAARTGLVLESACTSGANWDGSTIGLLREWRRGLRRRISLSVRSRRRPSRFLKPHQLPITSIIGAAFVGAAGSNWLGETAVYMIRREQSP